jgi:hypothetical protein
MSNYDRVIEKRRNLACGRKYKRRLWACKVLFRSRANQVFESSEITLDMAAKRRKKHKNEISGVLISICYILSDKCPKGPTAVTRAPCVVFSPAAWTTLPRVPIG